MLAAIPKAWRAARGWRANSRYWANIGWMFLGSISVVLWVILILGVLALTGGSSLTGTLGSCGFFTAIISIPCLLGAMMEMTSMGPLHYEDEGRTGREIAYGVFPPLVIFYHLPRGLWWVIRRTPRAIAVATIAVGRGAVAFVRFVPRFFWKFFLMIHSEERLICGVDAMLGAAAGYFLGSVLIGVVIGGLFGVVNHEVVTKRWLRPRGYLPARAK